MTPPMSIAPAVLGLLPLSTGPLGVMLLKCPFRPLKMSGTAALSTRMVKQATGQVYALISLKISSARWLNVQAINPQRQKLPSECSFCRAPILARKRRPGPLSKQSCLKKAFIFMDGGKFPSISLSSGIKPKPLGPLLSKLCSVILKDAKAIP